MFFLSDRPIWLILKKMFVKHSILKNYWFASILLLSHVWLFVTPWTAARQASLSITNSWSLLKLMSIESVMPSNHLFLCHPLFLLPSIFPSIKVFPYESALRIRWPKYWSFSFSISPSNEHSGLISFRMDWLDLLAVQGTLKSLLQHHSSQASILQRSAFFKVQLSHSYTNTGKTIALTRQTFVGKVMSLLFNMLSRLVITFLPRNKHLLISWLWLPSAMILKPPTPPKKISPPLLPLFPHLFDRMLEWLAVPFSRISSQLRDQIHVSHIAGKFFIIWVTRLTQASAVCESRTSRYTSWI